MVSFWYAEQSNGSSAELNNSSKAYMILPPGEHLAVSPDFFFFFNLLLTVLGLCCCTQASSSRDERGLLFVAVRGLLTAVAPLVVEHGLWVRGLQ